MKYLYFLFSISLFFICIGIPLVSWSYGAGNNSYPNQGIEDKTGLKSPDTAENGIGDLVVINTKISQPATFIRNGRIRTLLYSRLWYPLPDDALFDIRVFRDEFEFLSEWVPYYHSFSVLNNKYGVGLGIKLYE